MVLRLLKGFGEPRRVLIDYLRKDYADRVDIIDEDIIFHCVKGEGDEKFKREFVLPQRGDLGSKDFLLMHIVLVSKEKCANMDAKRHGILMIYNRRIRRIYIYDIFRYQTEGFGLSLIPKRVKEMIVPWLQSCEGNDEEIKHVLMNLFDTRKVITEYLEYRGMLNPKPYEWYPIVALLEIFLILENPYVYRTDLVEQLQDIPQDELFGILGILESSFEAHYKGYGRDCPAGMIYSPEEGECIPVRSGTHKSSNDIPINVLDYKFVDAGDIQHRIGSIFSNVIMLKYFAYNYSNVAVFLPKKITVDLSRTKYAIIWEHDGTDWNLKFPNGFEKFLKKVIGNPQFDFAAIYISLQSKAHEDKIIVKHANALLYSRKNHEIEHVEPHGAVLSERFDAPLLYERLRAYFEKYDPSLKYLMPIEYCPKDTKFFQGLENKEGKLGKEYGMCASWTLWYLNVRFANPQLTREKVILGALKKIQQFGSFRLFIENYESYHLHMIEAIYNDYISIVKKERDGSPLWVPEVYR